MIGVGVFQIFGVRFALEDFDAVAAGTFLLAIATFVLAFVTYRLLRAAREERQVANDALAAAREQAEIAQRHADVAEKTLAAQIQPLLVEAPFDSARGLVYFPGVSEAISIPTGSVYAVADIPGPEGAEVRCAIPFHNAGRGVAKVSEAWIEVHGAPWGYRAFDFTRPNIPVEQQTYALFLFRPDQPGFAELGESIRSKQDFVAAIQYSDISGRQVTTTRFRVGRRPPAGTGWEVIEVDAGSPDIGEIPPPGAVAPPAGEGEPIA